MHTGSPDYASPSYDLCSFGGSWAQRQVFSVIMIQAAVRANKTSLALAELKVGKSTEKSIFPISCNDTKLIVFRLRSPKIRG